MTNTQFVKLIRTCQGLETTEVTALDIIFAKAKAQGERVLNFDEVPFLEKGACLKGLGG